MVGMGILRGLGLTLKHFVETYLTDIRAGSKRYFTPGGIAGRSKANTTGVFTVQYPEEKLPVPEEFRYIPFLVYQLNEQGEKLYRCTACGICAKVCPPQCIWIVRSADPVTGKPVPVPAEFAIDVDICMNCGFCAEYCPFDAIKMDHDYEIASMDRTHGHIFNKDRLGQPVSYYQSIRPVNFAREQAEKAEKEAAKSTKKAVDTAG